MTETINWMEKVKILKKHKPLDFRGPKWKAGELEELQNIYPWLPESYLEYIREFDLSEISFCRFYGSSPYDSWRMSVNSILQAYEDRLKNDYYPFGADADGSQFLFNPAGEVRYWIKDDYDFEEEPTLFAKTFEEFVGECLLGSRSIEFLNEGPIHDFLKSQGWV